MEAKPTRYEELDSLRGIAAIIVVILHMKMTLPHAWSQSFEKIVDKTPLRLLYMGHESVVFFFLLSGFVLALPYMRGKAQPAKDFIVKRITRIWLPYIFVIALAVLLSLNLPKADVSTLGPWIQSQWVSNNSPGLLIDHFFLVGTYDIYAYNVSIWSLIHEMRISLFFPVLMPLILKWPWKLTVAIGMALGILGGALHLVRVKQMVPSLMPALAPQFQPLEKSLVYILMFLIGSVLCKHREAIFEKLQNLPKGRQVLLLVISILFYTYSSFLPAVASDWVATIGAIGIMMLALVHEGFSKFLLMKPLKWLGKVSYSLYLLHMVVILSMVQLFFPTLGITGALWLSVPVILLASWACYHWVEEPAMRLGRKLAARR